jgi:hypothetical protein
VELIEKITPAVTSLKPSAVTIRVGQMEADIPVGMHQDEPVPMIFPELADDSNKLVDRKHKRYLGGIRKPQPEDSHVLISPTEQPAPLAAETIIAPSQSYVAPLPAASQADSLKSLRARGLSRAWILSAVLLAGLIFLSIAYMVKSNQLRAISSDHPNSPNAVTAPDQRLRQAQSTITAQQNTIVALQYPVVVQQTPPANPTNSELTLLFGPVEGVLVHINDGLMKSYWANRNSKNFILNVVLVNPYAGAIHSWDTSIRFRRNFTDEYRLTIFSTQQWELTLGLSIEPVASGTLTNLKTGEGESNTVYLEVRDGIASLKVNNVLVPNMDVSAYQEAGDIGIAIGFRNGDEVDGETTAFKEFMLWKIP